jgi:hypothetical protein
MINIRLLTKGSSTGLAVAAGLPFTSQNTTNATWAITFGGSTAFAATTTAQLMGVIPNNVTGVSLQRYDAGTLFALTEADFTDATIFRISAAYQI